MSEGEVRDGYTMLMALPRQPAGSVSTRLSESDPSGTQFAKRLRAIYPPARQQMGLPRLVTGTRARNMMLLTSLWRSFISYMTIYIYIQYLLYLILDSVLRPSSCSRPRPPTFPTTDTSSQQGSPQHVIHSLILPRPPLTVC